MMIGYQIFEIALAGNNQSTDFEFEIESGWDLLTGISITVNNSNNFFAALSGQLSKDLMIDSLRFLPANMPLIMLVSGIDIPPCDRFMCVNVECPTKKKIKGGFVSNDISGTVTFPVELRLTLRLEKGAGLNQSLV
jgi:hypothetical protein